MLVHNELWEVVHVGSVLEVSYRLARSDRQRPRDHPPALNWEQRAVGLEKLFVAQGV